MSLMNAALSSHRPPGAPRATVLAFDVGGTRIKAGVVDGAASIRAFAVKPTDPTDGAGGLLRQIVDVGRELLSGVSAGAVGLSVKGLVDGRSGSVLEVNGPLGCLAGEPITAELADAFGAPVSIENDA